MSIRQIQPNLITLSAPFARFGRFKVGGRATIVKLNTGSLAVFSPVALTPEVRSTLTNLGGQVKYLTAMDFEHHIYIGDWAKEFPDAKVLGVEGLPQKREKMEGMKGTIFGHIYSMKGRPKGQGGGDGGIQSVSEEFDKEFSVEYVGSHANRELVFLHRPTRTLIEADLMFNLPAHEQYSKAGEPADNGLFNKLFIALQNTMGPATWQKRFVWHVASSGDRDGFCASVKRIHAWDFDRIIPCHGDVIESGGKGVFERVMEWHLKGGKKGQ